MKTEFLKYLLIGFVLIAIQACGQNNPKTKIALQVAETTSNDETQIIAMLKDFYTHYIIECDKMPVNGQNIVALKNKYFTTEFLKKWDEIELDYDPVLNAQDYNKDWIKTLEINSVPSQKDVYEVCYSIKENCIRLSVIKKDGIYLIDNIQGLTNVSVLETKQLSNMEWIGNYSITIDYGKLDEFSEMTINYEIVIKQDSCTFSGMGYKTYFTDLCKIQETGDELKLICLKAIDGDGFSDHSDIETIATLTKEGEEYYISSPIIADKHWEYNKKLPLNKGQKL
ncbi:MAG: YbjP/YqhG family protein [Tannerella sp.]|jgi:hypothetical protein|nr:YbjP/YqhG family protein [Tannerella sp.]